jgi:hypothetical protein
MSIPPNEKHLPQENLVEAARVFDLRQLTHTLREHPDIAFAAMPILVTMAPEIALRSQDRLGEHVNGFLNVIAANPALIPLGQAFLPHIPTDAQLLIGAILLQQQWIVDYLIPPDAPMPPNAVALAAGKSHFSLSGLRLTAMQKRHMPAIQCR